MELGEAHASGGRSLLLRKDSGERISDLSYLVLSSHNWQRVYTDANLTEANTIKRVEACVHRLQSRRKEHINAALLIDDKTDLVVEFTDSYVCKYYLADHSRKIVAWLEDWTASRHVSVTTVDGAEKSSHFGEQYLTRQRRWC